MALIDKDWPTPSSQEPPMPPALVCDLLIWPHTLLQKGLTGPLCLSHGSSVTHHQELHSEQGTQHKE